MASLNLHAGRDLAGRPYSVADALRLLSADVVALQENWRPHGRDSLARRAAAECGYHEVVELDVLKDTTLHHIGVVRDDSEDERGSWGLAVVSRVPLVRNETVWLGTAPGDLSARAALIVGATKPGSPALRLVNVHLTHRLPYGPGQLRRLLRAVPPQRIPTVLAGDFNMCRPTIYLAHGYRTAVKGRTWPSHRPVAQLDHILVGPGVEASGGRVMGSVGSDHMPVRVVLKAYLR